MFQLSGRSASDQSNWDGEETMMFRSVSTRATGAFKKSATLSLTACIPLFSSTIVVSVR
ncbi:hypothetical protein D3C73_1497960 [compost metagenome]